MPHRPSVDGREVVGLYGDPDTSWGIGVELGIRGVVGLDRAEEGVRELAGLHPHLGAAPAVRQVRTEEWETEREATLGAAYAPGAPWVRVLVTAPDDSGLTKVVVAAHHGVCDGLGLLALVTAATGVVVTPTAAGLGDRAPRRSFLSSAPRRVAEALRRPPPRFTARHPPGGPGEEVVLRTLPRARLGTVTVCLALAGLHQERRATVDRPSSHPLLVVGASRRPPGTVAPDRQTAYLRFRVDPRWTREEAARAFAELAPEPDFPETSWGGLGPRLVRPLRKRLGSTAVVSNLGVLEGEVAWVAMYPALSGPDAVSVGLATTATATTLSLRTRSKELGHADAVDLLDALVQRLRLDQ